MTPSAQTLEAPYIQRNIEATRAAYGLDDDQGDALPGPDHGQPRALRDDADTIPGIRLIDPSVVSDAFRQLQQIRQYYTFPDSLDVDRYTIGGSVQRQRGRRCASSTSRLGNDQRNWYNDHVVYTHGFGLVAAYGNRGDANGNPDLLRERHPVQRRPRHLRAAHLLR